MTTDEMMLNLIGEQTKLIRAVSDICTALHNRLVVLETLVQRLEAANTPVPPYK